MAGTAANSARFTAKLVCRIIGHTKELGFPKTGLDFMRDGNFVVQMTAPCRRCGDTLTKETVLSSQFG